MIIDEPYILRVNLDPSQLWSLRVASVRPLLRMTVRGAMSRTIRNFRTRDKCEFDRIVLTTVILSDNCIKNTTTELSRQGTRMARNVGIKQ